MEDDPERPSKEESSVLISIVNWDGRELLETCLQTLLDETDYDRYQAVVVDNGSSDGSVQMVRDQFPQVHLIENDENRGFSKGHNQALRHAHEEGYEYTLLLNNDTEIVDGKWLKELVSVMESNDQVGVCGCTVVEPNGDIHYNGRYFPLSSFLFPTIKSKYEYNRYEKQSSNPYEFVDDVVGAVFMIRTAAVKDIGPLDEKYSPAYYEESDYCVRAWANGYKVAYTDKTRVLHTRHQTSEKLDSVLKEYITHRNRIRFILTNYPLTWVLASLPFMLLQTGQVIVAKSGDSVSLRPEFRRRPLRSLGYVLRSYMEVFFQLPDIISKRQNRQDAKELLK